MTALWAEHSTDRFRAHQHVLTAGRGELTGSAKRLLRQLDTIETYDIETLDEHMLSTADRKEWSGRIAEFLEGGDGRQQKVGKALRLCGSVWLRNEYANGGKRYQTMYCGRRWCPICGNKKSKEKAAKLFPFVLPLAERGLVSLVTLTLKNSSEVELDRLWGAWRSLTRSLFWRRTYQGALANIELTVSRRGEMHWHLHALCVGGYMDREGLSDAWREITGDSFIVKIQQVKDLGKGLGHAVFEVCKYVAKGSDLLRLGAVGFRALDAAVRGRRFTARQGVFRGLPEAPERIDEEGGEEVLRAKGRIVKTEVLIMRGRGFDCIDAGTPVEVEKRLRSRGLGRLADMLALSRERSERPDDESQDLLTVVR